MSEDFILKIVAFLLANIFLFAIVGASFAGVNGALIGGFTGYAAGSWGIKKIMGQ